MVEGETCEAHLTPEGPRKRVSAQFTSERRITYRKYASSPEIDAHVKILSVNDCVHVNPDTRILDALTCCSRGADHSGGQ
jgi:hypothetical protein